MNIYVDFNKPLKLDFLFSLYSLAEMAYGADIQTLQPDTLQTGNRPMIYKQRKMGNKVTENELTGNWRKQLLKEIRIDNTRTVAASKHRYWGLCTEEIDWGRMRKTSGNKTIAQRKQAAKLMNGKRATKDLLVNMNIGMNNICDMCGDNKKETNRHIHCFCRGKEIVELRTKVKSEMIKLVRDCGGDRLIGIYRGPWGNCLKSRKTVRP
jgi:hypothetical protein